MSELSFLGRGWAFPFTIETDGEVAMVDEAADVHQAIHIILGTDWGERVMRPTFGANLRAHLFEPMTTTSLALVQHRVQEALVRWEPRIDNIKVTVTAEHALGRLLIDIHYRLRSTNTFYNLVYPFYLTESGES